MSKVAVVTGASGGIGREIVEVLGKNDFECILIGRSKGDAKNYYPCNFKNIKEVVELGHEIKKKFPVIDVLVNSAGIGIYKPMEEVTVEDWENSFAIGNTAPFFLTQALLPSLQKSNLSVVVNIGSGMGVIPAPGRSVYSSMKFALRGQTLSLAEEFKKAKPHFVLLSIGSVMTSFGPMTIEEKRLEMESGKHYLTPEWVARQTYEIIMDENRESEYTMYPSDYASEWQR